jgi:hypothetical protein
MPRARAYPQEEAMMNIIKEIAKLHVDDLEKNVRDSSHRTDLQIG